MITKEQANAELEALKHERWSVIPSTLDTDKVRTQVIHGRPAVRHTPRHRSLSEMDGEKGD